tara:strand:+ start:9403 stop:9717 length:315 start_codon:yes stop_codon:yes gene_type:complete
MNQKRSKEITERSNELFIEWLKSLLNETEAAKITMDNYRNYLPKQTHLYANKQLWLTAYTPRWIKNKLKRLLKRDPNRDINSLSLNELKQEDQQWKQKERNFQN